MSIINNTIQTYRTDLSEWAIIQLSNDGSWTIINPKASIDEEFIDTPDIELELTDKIQGYINSKEFLGSVLAVGIFRRLDADEESTLAALHSLHTNIVHDADQLHAAEQTRLSEWLAANGADEEEVKGAEFDENKAGDDSTGYDETK